MPTDPTPNRLKQYSRPLTATEEAALAELTDAICRLMEFADAMDEADRLLHEQQTASQGRVTPTDEKRNHDRRHA